MSARWQSLAIAGGAPAFEKPLAVGAPNIPDQQVFYRHMDEIFRSRRLTNHGPFVREFERRIAEVVGVKHCVATCNATLGLELLIDALGLTGSAIIPSFTFIATAHALERRGVRPIFVDVDAASHNLDPEKVVEAIGPDTSGILAVHLWGRPCAIGELEAIARERGLALIFDAAHAFGTSHANQMVGTFGDAEVFSFHATKAVNSFEGGAVVTDDDALAERIRQLASFGTASDGRVAKAGTNAKMTEPCAAMGLSSLEAMDAIFAHNRKNHSAYANGLADVAGLSLMGYPDHDRCNCQYVVVDVDADKFGLSRDELLAVLDAEHVVAKPYFAPGCHRAEPYASRRTASAPPLPVTERLCETVVCLPTGLATSAEDIAAICRILAIAGSAGASIRPLLAS